MARVLGRVPGRQRATLHRGPPAEFRIEYGLIDSGNGTRSEQEQITVGLQGYPGPRN